MVFPLDAQDLTHAALRDFLAMGAEIVWDTDRSLVLRRGGLYYGAGDCGECPEFRKSLMALCLDAAAAERMAEAGDFDDVTPVVQYVYTGPMPAERARDFTLRVLTEKDVPFLVANYHHPSATVKHLTERVTEGLMLGAFRDGQGLGFAGLHEEGALGMLEILPEYRRQGIASALVLSLTRRLLERGRVPYCHVYPSNTVSAALHESLGFTAAPRQVVWLCKHDAYTESRL